MNARRSISIVKERLPNETRVVLLPEHIDQFISDGFSVYVESSAGDGSGYTDTMYQDRGACIVGTDDAWDRSDIILKLFAPSESEYKRLDSSKLIGGFLHAEGRPALVHALKRSGCTAYAYEFFQTPNGTFPMAVPLSEISGQMAVLYGAYHLQKHMGGRGVLIPAAVGAVQARVLVIGYGNAGAAAARLSANMGAHVVVLGTNQERLRHFQSLMPIGTECYVNSEEILKREISKADLVIGAILLSTFDTPSMVDDDLVKTMKKGAMIVDVTCGHGSGYLSSFDHFTSHKEPVYIKHGVLHCKIDILPAGVPLSSAQANSSVIAPYLHQLARSLCDSACSDSTSAAGKIVENGVVVHSEIARNLKMIAEQPNRLCPTCSNSRTAITVSQ